MSQTDFHELMEHVTITKKDGVFVINIDAPIAIANSNNILVTGKNILIMSQGTTQIESEMLHLNALEKYPSIRKTLISNITSLGHDLIKSVSMSNSLENAKQIINTFIGEKFSRNTNIKSVIKKETIRIPDHGNHFSE